MNKDRESKKQELEFFSRRIKEVREKLSMTRAEMAEKLKISSVHVHQIETYGTGSWPTIINILVLFYTIGKINPLWLMIEDNRNIPQVYHGELNNQDMIKLLAEEIKKSGFLQKP